jgi:uncharacterized delta-60 repeat protein
MRGLSHGVAALAATGLLATSMTALATTSAAAAGDTDTTFSSNIGTGFNNDVYAVARQSDGKLVVGGNFTSLNDATSNYVARMNPNGTPDTTFASNAGSALNDPAFDVAMQSDGKIVVGSGATPFNETHTGQVTRFNSSGTPDTAFATNTGSGLNAPAYSVAVQSDGKIVVGGGFTAINGATSNYLARLNPDGTADTAFTSNIGSGLNAPAYSVAVQSDGKIVVGGRFTSFDGSTSNYVARLNSDGTPDATFTANMGTGFNVSSFDNGVMSIEVQPDDALILGGDFTTLSGTKRIARFSANGTPDSTFATNMGAGFDGAVESTAVTSSGHIIAVGDFATVNGMASPQIARFSASGTPDSTFSTTADSRFNNNVYAMALQPDGKIVVGGAFTSVNGTPSPRIARVLGPTPPEPAPAPAPVPAPAPGVTPAPSTNPTPDMQPPAAPQLAKKSLTKLKRKLAKGKAGAKSLRLKLRLSGDADARASQLQWRFKVKANKSQRAKKNWSGWKSLAVSTQASKAKLKVGKANKVRKSLTGRASDNAAVKLQIRAANDAGVSKATSVRLQPSKG